MNKIERKLYKIDASEKTPGRLATNIANILRGKNLPEFDPSKDMGGIVEVSNVSKMAFSGKKIEQKEYFRFSGYPGGLKRTKMSKVFSINPAEVLKTAVFEMLPDNKLRKLFIKRLIIR